MYRTSAKVLLVIGVAVLIALAIKSVGCGPFSGATETKEEVDIPESGTQTTTPDQDTIRPPPRTGIPLHPAAIQWWDTGLTGEAFHAAEWQGKTLLWAQTKGEIKSYTLAPQEIPGQVRLTATPAGTEQGTAYGIASHKEKLVRTFEEQGSLALQSARNDDNGELEWYTLRTFAKGTEDPPKQVAFLGEHALFYGKKDIFAINDQKQKNETFQLPFSIFPGVDYMDCGDDYCIGLYASNYPLMFNALWDWEDIPGSIRWKTINSTLAPFHHESDDAKKTAALAYTQQVNDGTIKPAHRLTVNDKQIAFLMRDSYLFWSCDHTKQIFQIEKDIENVRAVAWAKSDLLLLTKKALFVQYKAGRLAALLPKELLDTRKDFTFHSIRYVNGILLLEANIGTGTPHKLYAATYKTLPGYDICY